MTKKKVQMIAQVADEEVEGIAEQVLANRKIKLKVAKRIAERTGCHVVTGKRHATKAARRAADPDYEAPQWGGPRW